jgi:hypothetical protein
MVEQSFPGSLRVTDLNPKLSCAVLECVSDDPAAAFRALVHFVDEALADPGQAISVRIVAQSLLASPTDVVEDLGPLAELGFDGLYAIIRARVHRPGWATSGLDLADVTNELTLALRRGALVALRTTITDPALRRWLRQPATPYRLVPPEIVSGTFPGDSKAVWLASMDPRRSTKPDSKMVSGIRTQDVVNTIDDASSIMRAVRVRYESGNRDAVLRGDIVTNIRSRISWSAQPDLLTFFRATAEALDHIAASLANPDVPPPIFHDLPVPENNLTGVFGAFDIRVPLPGNAVTEPDADDAQLTRIELLREHLLDVHGEPNSPNFTIDVGRGDVVEGQVTIEPQAFRDHVDLMVLPPARRSPLVSEVAEALADGEYLQVYYESGHSLSGSQLARKNLTIPPFTAIEFENFGGFTIKKEKPGEAGYQAIHDAIGLPTDTSLFGWLVTQFKNGWLVCDDGPDEVADFLHLDHDGTLRAIHVKGAKSGSSRRRIAVKPFEEVVSQAMKNVRELENRTLLGRLAKPRIAAPATWHDGSRVADRSGFLARLEKRTARNHTEVIIVQPHLRASAVEAARNAVESGRPTNDSRRLALLDLLLHSAYRTITPQCHGLTVIGAE